MNRLTKGKALVGALNVTAGTLEAGSASVSGNLSVDGQFRQLRTIANIADGGSMTASAANVVTSRIITATPTEARNVQLPTAAPSSTLS